MGIDPVTNQKHCDTDPVTTRKHFCNNRSFNVEILSVPILNKVFLLVDHHLDDNSTVHSYRIELMDNQSFVDKLRAACQRYEDNPSGDLLKVLESFGIYLSQPQVTSHSSGQTDSPIKVWGDLVEQLSIATQQLVQECLQKRLDLCNIVENLFPRDPSGVSFLESASAFWSYLQNYSSSNSNEPDISLKLIAAAAGYLFYPPIKKLHDAAQDIPCACSTHIDVLNTCVGLYQFPQSVQAEIINAVRFQTDPSVYPQIDKSEQKLGLLLKGLLANVLKI